MPEKNRVDQLAADLGNVTDPFNRLHVQTILYSRIAAGLEYKEEGYNKTGFERPDEAWRKVDGLLSEMSEVDPKRAFSEAVNLALLPKSEDPKQELVNQWMRTTGLTYFGNSRSHIEELNKYLNGGECRCDLTKTLIENITTDISSFTEMESFSNPVGFTVVQSIYLGVWLAYYGGPAAYRISGMAWNRAKSPEVKNAAEMLSQIDGLGYLKDILS